MTTGDRDRIASGLYRSARKRGARDVDLRALIRLRTGKERTRDLTVKELVAIRQEVLALPAIAKEHRPRPETPKEYERRRRKEKLTQ